MDYIYHRDERVSNIFFYFIPSGARFSVITSYPNYQLILDVDITSDRGK